MKIKDLSDATVVMLYMGEDVNLRLRPILKKTLKPGARIVSHDFGMGDWNPNETLTFIDKAGDVSMAKMSRKGRKPKSKR